MAQLEIEQTKDGLRFLGSVVGEAGRVDLHQALEALHERSVSDGTERCRIDVRQLLFANSSAIGELVHWVSRAESCNYKVNFVLDCSLTWQRINFSALKALAPETVHLEQSPTASEGQTDA